MPSGRTRDLPHVVDRGLRDADEGAAQCHIQRRQVMAKRSMFVGMDVHKESIDISLAEEGRDGEVRHYGVIPGDLEAWPRSCGRSGRRTDDCASCMKPAPAGLGFTAISPPRGKSASSSIP